MKYLTLKLLFLSVIFLISNNVIAENLANRINNKFLELKPMGAYELSASIVGNTVTLKGKVSNVEMKEKLFILLKEEFETITLVDNIQIDSALGEEKISDQDIKAGIINIRSELGIGEGEILELQVEDGIVQIRGDFKSFRIVDQFLANVRGLNGVKEVKSKILVNGKDYLSNVITNY